MERRDKPGGLLRYGIPTMKLDRAVLDRRLDLMRADGVEFVCSVEVGGGGGSAKMPAGKLLTDYDATVLCLGSTWPRDLAIPGKPVFPFLKSEVL